MNCFARYASTTMMLALLAPALAFGQASRTWVSGVGDDANPCSRTAPCKTFAGAISKTAPAGEISVLDPGGYGAVTITKSLTINGDATLGSILVFGTNAIVVNAAATDTVILRNLAFVGINQGLSAIRFLAGGNLLVENCKIYGFVANNIDINTSTAANIAVRNTSITGGVNGSGAPVGQGIAFNGAGSPISLSLRDVAIKGTTIGVHAVHGFTDISRSSITNASQFGIVAASNSTVSVSDSQVFNNSIGMQAQPSATLRLTGNNIFDNGTNLGCGGGAIASANNNRFAGGTGGCVPTTTIAVQ